MRGLKALLGMAQRTDATAAEIEPTVEGAEGELRAARSAHEDAEASYRTGLLSSDDAALKRLADAVADAKIRLDRAGALRAALEERLAEAREREEEAQRVERYQAAQRQAEEAREVLRTLYPPAARDLASILRVVAEGEIAVRSVNADLPRKAEPLADIEASVRDTPGVLEKVHSERVVTRWCRPGDLRPDSVNQALVQISSDGRGFVQPYQGQAEYLVKRSFTETTYTPATTGVWAYALSTRLTLPGLLSGDAPVWEPLDAFGGMPTPDDVLKALRELEARAASPQGAPAPTVQKRYEPLGTYDLQAEMAPKPDARKAIRDRAARNSPNSVEGLTGHPAPH